MDNILFYRWGALGEDALYRGIVKKGLQCSVFAEEIRDFHADSIFAEAFLRMLHQDSYDMVLSYNYFPIVSMLCEINHITYVSWIYDCPLNTLTSYTVRNECNQIFCFDRLYAQQIASYGAKHIYHLPLAVEEDQLLQLQKETEHQKGVDRFRGTISFVGNFYNEDKNRIRNTAFSEYTKGYLEAVIEAQLLIYGYNLLRDSICKEVLEEIVCNCKLKISDKYMDNRYQLAADMVGMEVSSRERKRTVKWLSDRYPFQLYSSLRADEEIKGRYLEERGYADYERDMPHIFHNSKINLNMTSRTIQSGIPKRVLDILACGGFCLTSYQPEIAEFFVDGEDLVLYQSREDMLQKVDYYLTHEEERKQIALQGHQKVIQQFGMQTMLTTLLQIVEESIGENR